MIKTYQLKGKTFYLIQLSFTDVTGKRHQPKYRYDKNGNRISSEKTARHLEIVYLNELQQKLENDQNSMPFDKWHKVFLQRIRLTHKFSTTMQYDGDLKKWLPLSLSKKELGEISRNDVHSLVFEYLPAKGATPHTQRRIHKAVRRILEAAVDEGLISKNPAKGINVKVPPARKEVLNSEEAQRLLFESKQAKHSFYHTWAMALLTGMRSGELYALRWRDVDLSRQVINVNCSWSNKDGLHSTKSNKSRVIPISPDLKLLLLELRRLGPFKEKLKGLVGKSVLVDDLVLPRSVEWRCGTQAQMTQNFCKVIGITPVKFHDLRATFITNLLAKGVPLAAVMSIVGHSKMSTTDEYLRLAGVNVKGATESLGYNLPALESENVLSFGK